MILDMGGSRFSVDPHAPQSTSASLLSNLVKILQIIN